MWSEPRSAAAASASSSFSSRSERDHLGDLEAAFGHRAGLVEDHRVDLGGVLQNRAAAHQDAAARQSADGRDHGGRRRQNQRARARHDQHRDRAQPVPA